MHNQTMEEVTPISIHSHSSLNVTNTTKLCPIWVPYSSQGCVTFDFVIYTIFGGSCCIFGLLGNTISMIVLGREKRHAATAFLLQALAFADNCLLLFSFPALVIMRGLLPFIGQNQLSNIILQYYITIVNPMAYMALTQTILTTCVLAINRYIMVCRVFDAPNLCSLKMVRIQLAIVTLFSIFYNFPRFFQTSIRHTAKRACTYPTKIGHGSLFEIIYTNALFSILVFLLPFILLVVLNVRIIVELRSAWRTRRRLSGDRTYNNSGAEDNITKVMVVIIVVFLICHAPDRIYQILKLVGDRPSCGTALIYFEAICNLLAIVNSSTNFIIYCTFKQHFKSALLQLFCSSSRKTHAFTSMERNGQNVSLYTNQQRRTKVDDKRNSPRTCKGTLTAL